MKIAFYANRIHLDGDILEKQGTGGSESAMVNLSRQLKNLYPSYEITVYNGNQRDKKEYNGVVWKTHRDFLFEHESFNQDVFIVLREKSPFTLKYIDAKRKILWSQDDMNEIDLVNLTTDNYARSNVDAFFVISNHSLEELAGAFPEKNIYLVRNGYNHDWADPNINRPREPVAVYSSTPFRGLDILLEVWPIIFEACSAIYNVKPELRVFGDMSLYRQQNDVNISRILRTINTMPKARHWGAVSQKQLYEHLKQCKVMLYPNHFLETGCMAVLEALANGCWVVTTHLGALPEQVVDGRNGYCIKGNPFSKEYKDKFIERAIESLCAKETYIDNKGLIFSWEDRARLVNAILKKEVYGG
jgi:glycosyltransferase involved in cell wall biosynthesis